MNRGSLGWVPALQMAPGTGLARLGLLLSLCLALCPSLCPSLGLAQGRAQAQAGATLTMVASPTELALGEAFELVVRAQAQGRSRPQIQLPDLGDFRVLSSRVSRPMSIRFGSGAGPSMESVEEHRLVLQPMRAGTYRIAPARMVLGSKKARSEPITIRVGPSPGAPTTDPSGGQVAGQAADATGPDANQNASTDGNANSDDQADRFVFDPRAFLRTVVAPVQATVGQQITATVYLYVRGGLSQPPTVTQEPTADGFWVHDLVDPNHPPPSVTQVVKGSVFRVYVLRRFAAFALREGTLEIGAPELRMTLGSPLNLFRAPENFSRVGVAVPVHVQGLPALPGAARDDDTVLVGDFEASTQLTPTQASTGEATTLTLQVEGWGSAHGIRAPTLVLPGVRVLEPEVERQVHTVQDRVKSTVRFRWLLIGEEAGHYALAPFTVWALDPETRTYKKRTTPSLEFRVLAGKGGSVGAPGDPGELPTQEKKNTGIPGAGKGVLPVLPLRLQETLRSTDTLRSPNTLRPMSKPWSHSGGFWWLFVVAPGLWVLVLALGRQRRLAQRTRAQYADLTTWKAVERALNGLQNGMSVGDGDVPEKPDAASIPGSTRVLRAALQLGFSTDPAGLTRPELAQALEHEGASPEIVSGVTRWLEQEETARFSGSTSWPREVPELATLVTQIRKGS